MLEPFGNHTVTEGKCKLKSKHGLQECCRGNCLKYHHPFLITARPIPLLYSQVKSCHHLHRRDSEVLAHPAPAWKIKPGVFCLCKGFWARPGSQQSARIISTFRMPTKFGLPSDSLLLPNPAGHVCVSTEMWGLCTHRNLPSPPAGLQAGPHK